MPLPWTLTIAAVVVVALVSRIALPQLPLRAASSIGRGQVVALAVGVLGLVAHCTAMFFTAAARAVPGSGGYVDGVNGMGGTSMVLYAAPALLVLVLLWRVPRWVLAVVAALLLVVGVTMYDGGPLPVHLTAILLVVTALAATVAALVRGAEAPRDRREDGSRVRV